MIKKRISILLIAILVVITAACRANTATADDTTTSSAPAETSIEVAPESTVIEEDSTILTDTGISIVEENGISYFNATPSEFIKMVNAKNKDVMKQPFEFEQVPPSDLEGMKGMEFFSAAVSENGLVLFMETSPENGKIRMLMVGSSAETVPEGTTDILQYTALQVATLCTILDSNLESEDATYHLVDLAMAGEIAYNEDTYAYETTLNGIGYSVVSIDNIYLFKLVPVEAKANDQQ